MENDPLHQRIKDRLAELKMAPHAASVRAGLDKSYLRKMFAKPGSKPGYAAARALSDVLQMDLESETDALNVPPTVSAGTIHVDDPLRTASNLPPVPVRGTVAGSHESGAFQFDGSDVDYLERYPALAKRPRVYALYVEGDSMYPAHEKGALRFVDPAQPVKVGDTVVVTIMDPDRGLNAVLGNLEARGEMVRLAKLNPPRTVEFFRGLVHSVHHVLTQNELAGRE